MTVAKLAVAAATYWIDRPYDYQIPREMEPVLQPGMRVTVPFGRGNRRSEGVVLALAEDSGQTALKTIEQLLDASPVLTPEQLRLALWMRERCFCTVYDAVKAILPSGLWFDDRGERRAKDKYQDFLTLAIPAEEALVLAGQKRRTAPMQASILELLSTVGCISRQELRHFTGASSQSIQALVRAELVTLEKKEQLRRPEFRQGEHRPLPELTEPQRIALEGLAALAEKPKPAAALLHGVTGSGKTAIYAHLIAKQRQQGRGAILLVPEIALTAQMLEGFSSYFGEDVAVLHSALSLGERYDEWKRIRQGKAGVVIGTRSAVFAPVQSLGLLILDEEQEESYKSENTPRYHARDIAKYRCAHENAMLLLGSATPDITSRYYADRGRYHYFRLSGRYKDRALPTVQVVDMKQELRAGNGSSISSVLRRELAHNLERGQQSILFLNRRGANKLISCGSCGFTYECPNCSVSLSYHSVGHRLRCHYCGSSRPVDERCPACGGKLNYVGVGTQKLEQELHQLFPEAAVLRMDTDTVSAAGGHDALLERFRREKIPIMIGTQMVTKGLNFPNVTLVGVISADQSLYAGDYRASARTFSLLTQVVGRSGRGDCPGRAVIQTFTPDNQVIRQAAAQDYEAFYRDELTLRRVQGTPPFSVLYAVTASGLEESVVLQCCTRVRDLLQAATAQRTEARVLGPAPLFVARVNRRHRYRVLLCAPEDKYYRGLLSSVILRCSQDKAFRGVSLFGDLDPVEN